MTRNCKAKTKRTLYFQHVYICSTFICLVQHLPVVQHVMFVFYTWVSICNFAHWFVIGLFLRYSTQDAFEIPWAHCSIWMVVEYQMAKYVVSYQIQKKTTSTPCNVCVWRQCFLFLWTWLGFDQSLCTIASCHSLDNPMVLLQLQYRYGYGYWDWQLNVVCSLLLYCGLFGCEHGFPSSTFGWCGCQPQR